jgi:dihydrolipoamide dehydrogenase
VIDTEQAWALSEVPESMAVIGGGSSGVELASAYSRFGTTVTLFETADRILPQEDEDVAKLVHRALRRTKVEIRLGERYDGQPATWVVVAAGRKPDTAGLGLDHAGVQVDAAGLIVVDRSMRTSSPSVWAVGDLVSGPHVAHKAEDEGIIAAEALAGQQPHESHHHKIPRLTLTVPNVATFGLSEQQARAAGHEVIVAKVNYGAVGGGTVIGDRSGLVKVIADARDGRLLGAHVVGTKAPELIQSIVVAKHLDGGVAEIARVPHGHPTIGEAVMEAMRAADGWLIHG